MKNLMVGLLLLTALSGAFTQTVVIREISGTVDLKAPGVDWVTAAEGQRIDNGTIISTGFKSTALIYLENSVITVRPLTRLTLQEIQKIAENEKVDLYLQSGRVRADVNPPAGGKTDFAIRSPSITASVRGTSFEFDGRTLAVDKGRVHLSSRDRAGVYVSGGHHVAADTATGRIPGVMQTVKREMTPEVPLGVSGGTGSSSAGAFASLPVMEGAVGVETDW